MAKIINLKTGKEKELLMFNCTLCDCRFSEQEGGLQRGIIE